MPGVASAPTAPPRRSAATAVALALAAEAVLLTVDVLTGEDVILTGAFLLPPLALAVVASPAAVAGVVALAFVLAVASGTWDDYLFTGDHLVRLGIVGSAGALAVIAARARRGMVAAREEAERQRRRMEVLAAIGRLTDEPALQKALDRLVDALAPSVADAAWVELVDDRAHGRFSALRAVGEAGGALEAWRDQRPEASTDASPIARVLASGRSELIEEVSPAMLEAITDEDERRKLAAFGPRSAVVVALRARGRALGTLGLLVGPSGRRYGREDLEYVETVAGRAALAIANAQLVEELTMTRQRLDGILGALAEAVTVHDAEGRVVYANEAAAELLGAASADEVLATGAGELAARFAITAPDGSPVGLDDFPGRRLLDGLPAPPVLTRSVHRGTGRARWLLTKARLLQEGDDVLAVNVIEDVTEATDAELRQRFRAEAGQVLASSLDARAILDRLAALLVPALAGWSAIHLRDGEEEAPAEVARAGEGVPAGLADRAARVIAGGQTDAGDGVVVAPMRAGDEVIGALAVGSSAPLGDADVAFLEDLALRAASAVDTARLYEAQVRVSSTLQRSLLPERLIDVPEWEAGASYEAGERGADVGGDFYDVIAAGDDHLVVLGDVTGRGVEAAALTSLVRHTVRTAARFDPRPGSVVALLNQVLFEQPRLSPVTLVCARIARGEHDAAVTLCVAGHPLPLLKRAAAPPVEVGRHDIVLGVDRRAGLWSEQTVSVAPGETLLFYTDGVTDTPGRRDRFGEQRLAAVIERAPADPRGLLAAVDAELRTFESGTAADDRAMLALRHVGPGGRAPDVPALGTAA